MGYRRDTEICVVGVRRTMAQQFGQNRDQRGAKSVATTRSQAYSWRNDLLIMASGKEPESTQLPGSPGSQSARQADSAAAIDSGESDILRTSVGSGLIKQ